MSITFRRDGRQQTIRWQMPVVTNSNRLGRLNGLLPYLPFWLAGTVALLSLRPRDQRWRLLVSANYLTAFWLAVGMVSFSHIAVSSLVMRAVTWLLVPVYLHLHLLAPAPLVRQRVRYYLLPPLYASAVILAALELFQLLPSSAYALGLLLAVLGSLGLLLSRLFDRSSSSVQPATRLMLAGIGLAFGPGLVLGLIPSLLAPAAPEGMAVIMAMLAIPALPLLYTYAIYKRYLGPLEFRANRLLSLYSFVLLYLAAITLVLLAGRAWIPSPDGFATFTLAVVTVFLVAAPTLRTRFQRLVDRLAYGIQYNPDELLHAFARRIPATLDRAALARLLADEIAPSLLIRQSALYLLADNEADLVYARGVSLQETPATSQQLQRLLDEAGRYRPPRNEASDGAEYDWVRLAVPLKTRERTLGVWLFGRRDPEDYYPQPDVALLTALGAQVAVALENARLYEVVQRELAERQQAQEALYESEERFRDLYENAPLAYFSVGVDGSIIRCNRRAEKLLGYAREDLVGRSVFELYADAPQGKSKASQVFQRFRAGGTTTNEELQMHKVDGTPVWISLTVNAVRNARGQIVESRSMVMDITARKQAEAALHESEARYRTLFESAPIGIGLATPEGQVLACNDAMCRMTGYSEAELRQIDLKDTYQNPEDRMRLLEQLQADGRVSDFEVGLRRKDGTPYYASLTINRLTLDGQDVLLMMSQDITERKQAEEALRHSLEETARGQRLLLALSQAAQAVQRARTPDEVYQTVGDKLAELGYHAVILTLRTEPRPACPVRSRGERDEGPQDEALTADQTHLVISHLTFAPAWVRMVEKLFGLRVQDYRLPLAPGGTYQRIMTTGEATFAERGTEFMGEALPRPLRPVANRLAGQLGVDQYIIAPLIVTGRAYGLLTVGGTDLTEVDVPAVTAFANQAGIAIENAQLYEDLQHQMEELQRAQAQLIQSTKMAAIGTLAAGVAHELYNPLAVVLGFGQVLLKEATDDDLTRKGLTHIITETRRANDIVRGLLDFSRQSEQEQIEADVNQTVQETLALVRQLLEKSSVTVEERYASDLPLILLDVGRMKQVFLNLINNAFQAMPRGGTLTVTSERVGDEVAVRFADTGVGIPPDDLPRIFEPFFTTKPVGQGTGLGLSVSLGIVQEHGGRIEVESQEGQGSTFTVWLPVRAAEGQERPAGES
ncbi:MAG: PAS domain S-box protein [Promethearchaeota archaeon]